MNKDQLTIKELIKIYDDLYNQADYLFKYYNPCKITNNRCQNHNLLNGCCMIRNIDIKIIIYMSYNGIRCKHLTKNGCKAKCLWCKVWYCSYIAEQYPQLIKQLNKLHHEMHKYNLSSMRTSKRELFYRIKKERKQTLRR